MILALILMIPQGLQAFVVFVASGLTRNEADFGGGSLGIGAAFLYLIAGAFALAKPTVSLVVFLVAALFSLMAATADSTDKAAWVWLGVSLAPLKSANMM
jgi:Sec-independent protein secretion pathway component TatC